MYRMPHKCPICEGKLTVTQLSCPTCGSRLEGEFSGCRFCELSQEESRFLLTFIKNRGSIKDVEREMGVSYPTVRAALDGLIASLGLSTPDEPEQKNPAARTAQSENAETPDKAQARRDILNLLAQHRITAAEAAFLPWENFTLFFPGWGSLFLIVPAVYFLLRNPWSWFWALCLGGGALILLSKLDVLPMRKALVVVLGVLLILIGLRILLNPLFRRWKMRRMYRRMKKWTHGSFAEVSMSAGDGTDYTVRFGSQTYDMAGKNFTNATLEVAFGEMTFDLREALVQDNSVIDANCSFGQLTILLPAGVRAEIAPVCSFGGCENKRKKPKDAGTPTVYINVSCSFGEVEVK